ncbi:uncharacterized protein LOC119073094 isoform X2 [Bradysia coprophila]|uniref:uncharacterized protein LOC119073094 isoform X2 n=1 Tax=Bradysia coprophila TaxID=38358 RepID=UPI00187DA19D|nr:uncharacterized protein LOC119073094 isoform X2 [Bradysia coprophila]
MSQSEEVNSDTKNFSENTQGQVSKPVMALAGNIEPFVQGTNFESYEDRVSQFFVANDIKEEKKTSMFITISGEAMYDILKSLTCPDKPSSKSYTEIMKLLREHFTPKSNKRAERYKFNQVVHETGEKISDFIVRLKSVSQKCKFGDFLENETGANIANYKMKVLDEALTDRFIVGLKNEKIQQALLSEDKYNFEQCCEKALQMEMVQKETKSLQPSVIKAIRSNEKNSQQRSRSISRSNGKSNFKERSGNRSNGTQCGRCGRSHDEKTCPARDWKCYKCQKVGHISPMCRSKKYQSVEKSGSQPALKTIRYDERDSGNFIKQIKEGPVIRDGESTTLEITVNTDDVKWVEQQQSNSVDNNKSGRTVKTLKRIGGNALEYELDVENKKAKSYEK